MIDISNNLLITVLIIVILAGILISVFEAFSSKGQAVPNLTRREYRPYRHFNISSWSTTSKSGTSVLLTSDSLGVCAKDEKWGSLSSS